MPQAARGRLAGRAERGRRRERPRRAYRPRARTASRSLSVNAAASVWDALRRRRGRPGAADRTPERATPCGSRRRVALRPRASRTISPLSGGRLGSQVGQRPVSGLGSPAAAREHGLTRRLIGLELTQPGIAREGYLCSWSPVGGGRHQRDEISHPRPRDRLALVESQWVDAGSVEIRGREAAARTPVPFYRRQAGAPSASSGK